MKRSLLWLVLAAFAGAFFISWWGTQRGWTELTIFLVTAGFMSVLAVVRRGVTRPIMLVLIVLQAIPVFGLGTVLLWALPIVGIGVAVMWRIYIERLKRSTLVFRADNHVAPGARRVVEDLLRLGFQTVGSVDARGPDYKTVFTYLVSSDRRTFAVAADRVGTLASLYGDRILVTIDRSSTPVPATELRQLVHGDIGEMYEAHKGALEVISGRSEEPDHLVPARVIERAIEHETRSLQYLGDRPWWVARQKALGIIRRRPPDSARITDDQATAARVESWIGSDTRPQLGVEK
ncbi:MAG TPA: hypothetical protein VM848_08960 [Acidimicrobiia bacterium]|nr:hypothetical protein [Acidimicrobiia bacterium]